MPEGETILCDLRHAVVVNERSGYDEHVEYLMTLKLQPQWQQDRQALLKT